MISYRQVNQATKAIMIILITTLVWMTNAMASKKTNDIEIDPKHQLLVAPEGNDFCWYRNGKPFNQVQRAVSITESGLYEVFYTAENGMPAVASATIVVENGSIRKIYIIGDSTVQTYDESYYPQAGWGQVLGIFFDQSRVSVINKAIGGRSSRSFWEEGRWTEVKNLLDTGDFVFIQFGHNDRDWTKPERYTDTSAYKEYLRIYVNETRAKGAVPVLISPMIMHAYSGVTLRNVFTENENDYRGAMAQVADELNALFIDLNMKSYSRIKELGQEYAANFIYLGLLPGEYSNYPDGKSDGTHFQEMGAIEMARLIVEGIGELSADTSMVLLIDAMLPSYQMVTSTNLKEAGLVTVSGKYPAGMPLTVKIRLMPGYTFNHWEENNHTVISTANLFKFNMAAHDTAFIANFNDCNGVAGGSASYDDCGFCSGGNTGTIPCAMAFQSENACFYSGSVESQTVNNVKRMYVNTSLQNFPSITFSITAPTDTLYVFGIVYATTNNEEEIDLAVNGDTAIHNLKLNATEEWNIEWVELPLLQGNNLVKIISRVEYGGLKVDLLAAYSEGLSRGTSCRITGIKEAHYQDIIIFPNPSDAGYTVKVQGQFEYRIFDLQGRLLYGGTGQNSSFIGDHLQVGRYLLQIIKDNSYSSLIIVKTE